MLSSTAPWRRVRYSHALRVYITPRQGSTTPRMNIFMPG